MFRGCRIPESTTLGMLKSRVQCDRSIGEVKISREHREDLLKQLIEEIRQLHLEKVDDVLIVGDSNQDMDGEPMREFMRWNVLIEVHDDVNNTEENSKDNKHTKGSKNRYIIGNG